MNIILCGGGTAGHINPAIALYDVFKDMGHKPYMLVSTKDSDLIPMQYRYNTIKLKSPGNFIKKILFALGLLPALLKSLKYLKEYEADVVIGMGGFVSFPVLLAANMRNINIYLCEQNSHAGKVNIMFYHDAKTVYHTFSKSLLQIPKGEVFGNPIRRDFFITNRDTARASLELKENQKLLVITGGSQGAYRLNELFLLGIEKVQSEVKNLKIVWLTGKKWLSKLEGEVERRGIKNVTLHSYYRDMPSLLYAADFCISRSGSGAISELLVCNLPSLLIPFPYATDNHQYDNARELMDKGLAFLMTESALDESKLTNFIIDTLNNETLLLEMRKRIEDYNIDDAGLLIAYDIVRRQEEK